MDFGKYKKKSNIHKSNMKETQLGKSLVYRFEFDVRGKISTIQQDVPCTFRLYLPNAQFSTHCLFLFVFFSLLFFSSISILFSFIMC